VTWKTFRTPVTDLTHRIMAGQGLDGAEKGMDDHEQGFTDIDVGYEFYQDLKKGRSGAYSPTWEHIDG
jgi:hypothetical protein